MGDDCLTLREAWKVYDRWLRDPKVEFSREPAQVDDLFRRTTKSFSQTSAPKALGDSYLLALSQALDTTLVTYDIGLSKLAARADHKAVLLT